MNICLNLIQNIRKVSIVLFRSMWRVAQYFRMEDMFGERRAESVTEGAIGYGMPARYFNNGRYNVIIMCIISCPCRLI
jgi:hypothetical protein